jgi:hypothetical protein
LKGDRKSCQQVVEETNPLSKGAVIVLIAASAVIVVFLIGWFAWRYRKRGEKKPNKKKRKAFPNIDCTEDTKIRMSDIIYIEDISREYYYQNLENVVPTGCFQFEPETEDGKAAVFDKMNLHEPGSQTPDSNFLDRTTRGKSEVQTRIKSSMALPEGGLDPQKDDLLPSRQQINGNFDKPHNNQQMTTTNQVLQRPASTKHESTIDPHSIEEDKTLSVVENRLKDQKVAQESQAQECRVFNGRLASPLFNLTLNKKPQ